MSENLSETKHNSKIARLFHPFLRLSLTDKSALIIKVILALLIGLKCFSLVGLYFQKSHWIASHRPDCTDVSSYYMASHILHKGQGAKLYDYLFQESQYVYLYQSYIDQFKTKKPIRPSFISPEEYLLFDKDLNSKSPLYYYYPPNTLWFLYLLGFTSIAGFQLLMGCLSILSLLIGVFYSTKYLAEEKADFWEYLFLFGIGIICYPPFRFMLANAQLTMIISISFFFYYYFQKQKKLLLSGLFLSICLFKPQMGIPLLLLPIIRKQWKTLIYLSAFISLQLIIGLIFVGAEGYKEYLASTMQLIGIKDFGLFLPHPGLPTYPLNSIASIVLNQMESCSMNMKKILDITNKVFSIGILGITILLLQKSVNWSLCQNALMNQNILEDTVGKDFIVAQNTDKHDFLLIALIIISSFLLIPYHHIYDYLLLITICLIGFDFGEQWFHKTIMWFVFICSFGWMLLTSWSSKLLIIDTYDPASVFWIWIICLITFIYLSVSMILQMRKEKPE